MEERHRTEINAIHEKYEEKIKEFEKDKAIGKITRGELTKSIIEETEKIKVFRKDIVKINEQLQSLENTHSFLVEFFTSLSPLDRSVKLKEQLNNNPKLRNKLIEYLNDKHNKFPFDTQEFIDLLLKSKLAGESNNN